MVETDDWEFIKARWYTPFMAGTRHVRLIVVHTMETAERAGIARDIALDFARRPPSSKASAHVCIDDKEIIQSVRDNNIAFAAPGANSDGIHLELAGRARQTEADWGDAYSVAVLENAANVAAQYCVKYNIPIKHLTNAELADKRNKGLCGHNQVSEVFKISTHTDPGKAYPWLKFLERVAFYAAARKEKI